MAPGHASSPTPGLLPPSPVSDSFLQERRLSEFGCREDNDHVHLISAGVAEAMRHARRDVKTCTGFNWHRLTIKDSLPRSPEKHQSFFHRMGMQQNTLTWLEPLLTKEQ